MREPVSNSIPEALELIPVAPPTNTEISDPLGLIPGSVPFPAPTDPEDGYYRVNPGEGYASIVVTQAPPQFSTFFVNHQCAIHSSVSTVSTVSEACLLYTSTQIITNLLHYFITISPITIIINFIFFLIQ